MCMTWCWVRGSCRPLCSNPSQSCPRPATLRHVAPHRPPPRAARRRGPGPGPEVHRGARLGQRDAGQRRDAPLQRGEQAGGVPQF